MSNTSQYHQVAWNTLTKSQKKVSNQLAKLLTTAAQSSSLNTVEDGQNIAFISGRRGSGKSSLLHLFQHRFRASGKDEQQSRKELGDVEELFREHGDHVAWLEPIQLDPLPRGSNLAAAILSRLSESNRWSTRESQRAASVLDPINELDRARNELSSLQTKALLALEGNLASRAERIDQDTFAVHVMENERSRPSIREKLSRILNRLVSKGSSEYLHAGPGLYVIVIDDIDIRPARAVEALQLATLLAIPRLFFIFSGNIATIDQLLLYHVQNEFLRALGNGAESNPFVRGDVEGRSNEIASSLLRKMVPPNRRLTIDVVDIDEAWTKIEWKDARDKDKSRTLKQVVGEITKFEGRFGAPWHLGDLLSSPESQRSSEHLPGSQDTLRVPPRHLHSLYETFEAVRVYQEKKSQEKKSQEMTPQEMTPYAKLREELWKLFEAVIDEDPNLGIPAQRKLQAKLLGYGRGGGILPIDDLVVSADFGEHLEAPALGMTATEPDCIHVHVAAVGRRNLSIQFGKTKIEDSAEAKTPAAKPDPDRMFAHDTTSMFMLIHDICAMSPNSLVIGKIRWKSDDIITLAHTSSNSDEIRVPWLSMSWPTFSAEHIFLTKWNNVVTHIGDVQRQKSDVKDNRLAQVLAIGFCWAIIDTYFSIATTVKDSILEGEGKIEQWSLDRAVRRDDQDPDKKWIGTTAAVQVQAAIADIENIAKRLQTHLETKLTAGEDDALLALGFDVLVQLEWMMSPTVRVLTPSVTDGPSHTILMRKKLAHAALHAALPHAPKLGHGT